MHCKRAIAKASIRIRPALDKPVRGYVSRSSLVLVIAVLRQIGTMRRLELLGASNTGIKQHYLLLLIWREGSANAPQTYPRINKPPNAHRRKTLVTGDMQDTCSPLLRDQEERMIEKQQDPPIFVIIDFDGEEPRL